jgi:DNA-binding XRE family transcriptional regulator
MRKQRSQLRLTTVKALLTMLGMGRTVSLTGQLVSYWLERQGMTQTELAGRIGVDRSAVSQWVTGDTSPKEEHIPKIAEAFRLTMASFYAAVNHLGDGATTAAG